MPTYVYDGELVIVLKKCSFLALEIRNVESLDSEYLRHDFLRLPTSWTARVIVLGLLIW